MMARSPPLAARQEHAAPRISIEAQSLPPQQTRDSSPTPRRDFLSIDVRGNENEFEQPAGAALPDEGKATEAKRCETDRAVFCVSISPRHAPSSPAGADGAEGENGRDALPVLLLEQFARTPTLEFGSVTVGTSKTLALTVRASAEGMHSLAVAKLPSVASGFSVSQPGDDAAPLVESDAPAVSLAHGTEAVLLVTWTPPVSTAADAAASRKQREALTLLWNGRHRLRVVLLGTALDTERKRGPAKPRKQWGPASKHVEPIEDAQQPKHVQQRPRAPARQPVAPPPRRLQLKKQQELPPPQPAPLQAQQQQPQRALETDRKPQSKFWEKLAPPPPPPPPPAKHALHGKLASARVAAPLSASGRIFFDEQWADKQERGFTQWLNYALSGERTSGAALNPTQQQQAPGVAALSTFQTLISMRAGAALRRRAVELWRSRHVEEVVYRIERQVSEGKIAIRADREVHNDVGVRRQLVDLLFCVDIRWLRIGLETVYGRVINCNPALPPLSAEHAATLKQFLREQFFADADLERRFASVELRPGRDGAKPIRRFGPGYREELNKKTLRVFFKLLFFLDVAKRARLMENDPCLFRVDAPHKSLRELAVSFCKDFLSGEGDIARHLALLGCELAHRQTPLDEYNFAVTNLAVDLRDGVRLTKLAELIVQSLGGAAPRPSLLSFLRLPADSRLRKLHNVDVALHALAEAGLPIRSASSTAKDLVQVREAVRAALGDCCALGGRGSRGGWLCRTEEVVDGFREHTLAMLWNIILFWDVYTLLDAKALEDETARVRRAACLGPAQPQECWLSHAPAEELEREQALEQLYMTSPKLQLLLQWLAAVVEATLPALCAANNGARLHVPVHNFSTSLADGRALCLLLHYYHPQLLSLSEVRVPQRDASALSCSGDHESKESEEAAVDRAKWVQFYAASSEELSEAAEAAQHNFNLVNSRVQQLGFVPVMLRAADVANGVPDEKVMITFVTYLFMRLRSLGKDVHAVRVVQSLFRAKKARRVAAQLRQARAEARRREERAEAERRAARAKHEADTRMRQAEEEKAAAQRRAEEESKEREAQRLREEQEAAAEQARKEALARAAQRQQEEEARLAAQRAEKKAQLRRLEKERQEREERERLEREEQRLRLVREEVERVEKLRREEEERAQRERQEWEERQRVLAAEEARRREQLALEEEAMRERLKREEEQRRERLRAEEEARRLALQREEEERRERLRREEDAHMLALKREEEAARERLRREEEERVERKRREEAARKRAAACFRFCATLETASLRICIADWRGKTCAAAAAATALQAAWRGRQQRRVFAALQEAKQVEERRRLEQRLAAIAQLREAVRVRSGEQLRALFTTAKKRLDAARTITRILQGRVQCKKARCTLDALREERCRNMAACTVTRFVRKAAAVQKARRELDRLRAQARRRVALSLVADTIGCLERRSQLGKAFALLAQHAAEQRVRTAAAATIVRATRSFLAVRRAKAELSLLRKGAAQRRVAGEMVKLALSAKSRIQKTEALRSLLEHMHSWRRSYAVATAVCQRATKRRVLVQLALARRAGLQRRAAQVAFMERKRRDRMVASAITLQRGIRAWRQRRAEARRVAAAQVIQAAARRYLSVRDAVRRERAALVLQSWARGHAARRRAAPAIAAARRRLLAASEAARKNPKLRIGYRLATALEALLTSRQLSVVTQALRSLDQVTRVLPICCEEVVKLGAIQVMLALMQSCNRSLPHQELVSVALSVLRNIAAYASTARTVFEPHNLVDVLTELMQIYRDKEDLFAKATALLLAGTRVRGFALYVRGLPDIPRRLRGLAAVLENKLKMAERLSRPTPEAQQRFVAQKANLAQLQQLLAALDAP